MYTRYVLGVCSALYAVAPVLAQDPGRPDAATLLDQLRQLRSEREEDRDRIDNLEQQIAQLQDQATVSTTPSIGAANAFNPEITIYGDFVASLSSDGSNNALNRFSMREVEIDARAAIGPWVDGALAVAIAEEVEPDPNVPGDVSVETVFELEQIFADFHTLPGGFSARAGKFRNAFGRNNLLHTHDLPQITRPLASTAFFGHEGLSTVGVEVDWLAPVDEYIEFTVEVVNADGGSEAPILGGPNAENPAAIGHAKWFTDLSDSVSVELGASYMFTRTGDHPDFEGHVFGGDFTCQWIDPEAPDSHSAIVQGEIFWADNDIQDPMGNAKNESLGAYAFAQYQPMRDVYFGVRGDFTEFPDSEDRGLGDKDWGVSPYVSWYPLEFLRVRGEYQHRDFEIAGVNDSEDNIFVNVTFVFGSHPAHPYWVNR